MPYIKKEFRKRFDEDMYAVPEDSGELNYLITDICDSYIGWKGKSYKSINDVIGALECAKLELYRRVAAPYEDLKMKENGEVYTV